MSTLIVTIRFVVCLSNSHDMHSHSMPSFSAHVVGSISAFSTAMSFGQVIVVGFHHQRPE
jgi:hypothetical protein